MTNKCMVSFLLMAGVCLTATASPKAIPFRVVRNLMVIQATVNWQTGNFIFDTGTSGMVLNARYFEGRTDLTTDCGGFQSIIGSNDGCRGDFVQLHFEELSVRGYAAVVDLQPLEQSKRMNILGILGLQALKQYEIVIDYHYEEIWMIGEGSPYIFSPEKDEWIDLSKLIASDGLVPIIADIEYHPARGCWVIGTGGLTRLNPGTQPQSFSNLALDKPVKASSREDDNIYFPEYAVDGDPYTRWSSAYSEPEWLEIDLERSEQISQINLYWESCHAIHYEVQFSEDGERWQSVYRTRNGKGGKEVLNLAGKARYLKFLFTLRSGPYCFGLWEVEVFGPLPQTKNQSSLTGMDIFEDRQGGLWFASFDGLMSFDPESESIDTFRSGFKRVDNGMFPFGVGDGYPDRQGFIWVFNVLGDYWLFDTKRDSFIQFQPVQINPEKRRTLRLVGEDKKGDYWFKSPYGLYRYRMESNTIQPYLPGYEITAFLEDNRGRLWAGTKTSGLFLLDEANGAAVNYSSREGLANPWVTTILEDRLGRLWLGTAKGLSCFSPEDERFDNYYQKDGLIQDFIGAESFQDTQGRIYIGGDGFTYFDPVEIHRDTMPPKIVISALRIGQKLIRPGEEGSLLSRHISQTRAIRLAHHQNAISLEFTALHYQNPEKNRYRIMLEGLDTTWVDLGQQKNMTYAGLVPGNYTFKVNGSNADGIWAENPAVLHITVRPPWYWAGWSKVLYLLIAFSLTYYFYRFQLNRQLASAETRRLKELDTVKTRLYTNITHEFRTPLTVISGMARQVLDDPKEWFREGLHMILRNSGQLLNLVNQMLDLSKLESGRLPVNLIQDDIVQYLKYLTESFHSYAETKDIRLHLLPEVEELHMDFDPEKIQTIFCNLVSNAIKYTPAGGDVYITVDSRRQTVDGDSLEIKVKDTGIGIPEVQLPYIFDRFYQGDDSSTRRGEGTGIGLALTGELVKLLDGEIEVSSREGKGAEFRVLLPVRKTANKRAAVDLVNGQLPFEEPIQGTAIVTQDAPATDDDQPLALLIEDNRDVLRYLASCLQGQYRLETAVNGQEGINKAIELVPDIIISDVMMPEKDGFEVVAALKQDERTSHIPIILLTAKADQYSKIAGLKSGADAYLAKPFDKKELEVRLRKLVELRRKLQARYCQLNPGAGSKNAAGSIEDAFLLRLRHSVEENLSDEGYGIPELCRGLGVSRAQLHRKLKALTGKSTSHVVRTIRLQKAKELLESSDLNVSEVGYAVGFVNRSHFTTVFKEEFGEPPSYFRSDG